MNIIRRTMDIDAETDARLREMADERGQDVAAVLAEAVALLDSVVDIAGPDVGEDRRRLEAFKRTRAAVPLGRSLRDSRVAKAELGRFFEARLPLRYRTDSAGQGDFAEKHRIGRECRPAKG